MQDADDLERLRKAYQGALATYEGVCATLNRHALARTRPSAEEQQAERDARAQLEATRRTYLDALLP